MNFENSEFLKLLESKEVPLEKLSKVLCRGISCTDVKTVQEFVLKYEKENGTILLHQWKEIFKALGYLDEFSGVLQHAVGQFQRHHDSNPNVDADISLALSRPEASCVQTEDITRTTNLRALAQCSGAIPKKRPTPQKHIEFSADQVSVNGLHVDEGDSCVKDQVGCPLMTPGLPESEKKVLSEQSCTVHDHSAASVTVVTEDACVQNSGQKGATDDETSLMESNFDLQQMSVDAVKGEVSEKPSAAPLGSTCLQTFQMEGNVEPDHGSIPFAAAGEDVSGYFSVQDMETDTGMPRASNELTLVNNKENEEQCQQMSTALLHADSCQVQQRPAGLINDSTAVIPTMAEAVPSLPHESMLVTGQGNNNGLQSQETGNPSEHYNATENSMPVQDFQEGRIDRLQSNIIFLSQELEERTVAHNNLEVHIGRLQRELLDCRGRCTGLEEQNQELIQIQQEKHQMIAQTNQMLQWKQEECNRLEEHIRESEAQYNNAIASMVTQRTTLTALQMESSESRREVQNLREEREQFTLQERERLRRENKRVLDAKFEEVCLAYHNAETDEVKGLKEKLSKEEETRKKTEETNKQLRQEVESLRTLLRQCSPHADRGAAFSDHVMPREENETVDSTEDGPSSNASTSEVEMDNASGSPGSIQQSGALAQRSGAIPKKRPTPQKHIESDVKDQVGCPLMTPGLPEPEKKVLSEQCCTGHDHSAAPVTVVTEDASGQISGQKRATDGESSLMENMQQMSVEAVKGDVSEKPLAAPLGSTCLPITEQTFQTEGSDINAEPNHGSTPFAAVGEDECGYFSVQNMEANNGIRVSNEQLPSLTPVNNLENEVAPIKKEEEECQQTSTALLHADSCQVQQPPAGLINDSSAVTPATAETVPSLPHESMLVTGQGNNSGLRSQETGNPSEHYDTTEDTCSVQVQDLLGRLDSNVVFLHTELQERILALHYREFHISLLQHECASLEERKQELIQIQQEKDQMIAQTNQMLQWKQEECIRLEEMLHCKQEECNQLQEEVEYLRTVQCSCGAAFSDHVVPREENETVDSAEDETSNASTSEVEMDNAAGSPGSIQQSETRAPDELQRRDQEFLEDAGKEVNRENRMPDTQ